MVFSWTCDCTGSLTRFQNRWHSKTGARNRSKRNSRRNSASVSLAKPSPTQVPKSMRNSNLKHQERKPILVSRQCSKTMTLRSTLNQTSLSESLPDKKETKYTKENKSTNHQVTKTKVQRTRAMTRAFKKATVTRKCAFATLANVRVLYSRHMTSNPDQNFSGNNAVRPNGNVKELSETSSSKSAQTQVPFAACQVETWKQAFRLMRSLVNQVEAVAVEAVVAAVVADADADAVVGVEAVKGAEVSFKVVELEFVSFNLPQTYICH
mmetsp:Transcript_11236/g.20763  ORF Transcript_11236/g.20763 Transcript_11236/m.20763 type:complete len:266 (-) Transcript_11236:12-809(-)